jgi:hypothetical protein
MCDQVAADMIDVVVKEWLDQKRAFTSYEVSKEVQNRLKVSGRLNWGLHRHQAVRDYYQQCQPLRDEVEYGDYKEQLVDVGGGNQATLYFPDGYDPSKYKPLTIHRGGQQAAPVQSLATTSVPFIAAGPAPVRSQMADDGTVEVKDKLSILRIPKTIMEEAGFQPGDQVYVSKNQDTVVLSKQAPNSTTTVTIRRVENRGGLRFYKSVRREEFGMKGDKFQLKADPSLQQVELVEA